jgi:hypothetical protein
MRLQPAQSAPSAKPPPPRAVTRAISLGCTLTRGAGSPIRARTIDLGLTGMRVVTERPLAVDETVTFNLLYGDVRVCGHALVVWQERPDLYDVRFRPLGPPMAHCLQDIVSGLAGA